MAAYGELAYHLTDGFKVSASGRYTDEKLSYDNTQKVASGAVAGIPGRYVGSILGASKSETNFSWRLVAQYDFANDMMVFASAAKGYKGPAYEQQPASSQAVFVEPEIPTSYELGFRSMLFDGTTMFNLTVFRTDFDNFQAQAFDPSATPARFTVVNAGGLRTEGVEADLTVAPVQDLRITAGLTYLDAEFTDYTNVACYIGQPILPYGTVRTSPRQCIRVSPTGAGVTEGTGLPPPDAPKLTYRIAVDYSHPVGGYLLTAAANWYWRDETLFGSNGDPYLKEDSYGLFGASVGIANLDNSWSISLFGKNLFDEHFVNRVIPMPVLNSPAGSALGSYGQFPSLEAEQIFGVAVTFKLAR
jgi:iron complex outermembrane receptor protein